jgi:hypothetical protein
MWDWDSFVLFLYLKLSAIGNVLWVSVELSMTAVGSQIGSKVSQVLLDTAIEPLGAAMIGGWHNE